MNIEKQTQTELVVCVNYLLTGVDFFISLFVSLCTFPLWFIPLLLLIFFILHQIEAFKDYIGDLHVGALKLKCVTAEPGMDCEQFQSGYYGLITTSRISLPDIVDVQSVEGRAADDITKVYYSNFINRSGKSTRIDKVPFTIANQLQDFLRSDGGKIVLTLSSNTATLPRLLKMILFATWGALFLSTLILLFYLLLIKPIVHRLRSEKLYIDRNAKIFLAIETISLFRKSRKEYLLKEIKEIKISNSKKLFVSSPQPHIVLVSGETHVLNTAAESDAQELVDVIRSFLN